jgi:hypothetical protein
LPCQADLVLGLQKQRLTTMKTKPSASTQSAAIWQHVIQFKGELSPAAARALLKFGFSEHDHDRMKELATKARAGTLDPSEQAELDTFERLGCLLDIVHSQARQALKKKPKRAS